MPQIPMAGMKILVCVSALLCFQSFHECPLGLCPPPPAIFLAYASSPRAAGTANAMGTPCRGRAVRRPASPMERGRAWHCRSVPASRAAAPPPALLSDLSHGEPWPFKAESTLPRSWNLSAMRRPALLCRVLQTLPNPDTWPFLVTLKVKKKY